MTTPAKPNNRSELETLIREFQTKLGNQWERYHETLSLFLIGKLSRSEFVAGVKPILNSQVLINFHNKLLLINFANSLRDIPLDLSNELVASFWNKKIPKTNKVKSSQYEKFKQNIMELPIRERRRIKNITKDSGKKNKLSAGITLTRHTLLPKIPMIQDKDKQQLNVNNLVQWQQDVVKGINTPIATQNYELPDYDNLSKRILMTMREYGLTGMLNAQVLEVILLGLESHLKNIIESAMDVSKYRENKYTNNDYIPMELKGNAEDDAPKKRSLEIMTNSDKDITLGIEDMYNTFEMFPHLIEPCGPSFRLTDVMLENDYTASQTLDYTLPPEDTKPVIAEVVKTATVASAPSTSSTASVVTTANATDKLNGKDDKKEEVKPVVQLRPDAHIGSTDELKWVLHELVSTM